MTLPKRFVLAVLVLTALAAGGETPPPAAPEHHPDPGAPSAIRLFASAEEAWSSSDIEQLASLVDTTSVRIAVKPGAPLTSAVTRVAAAFLLQDQLRLVRTLGFQVTRLDCDTKRGRCRATALWTGDWGGRQGTRKIRVTLTARPRGGRWLLTEIRAED